MVVRVQARSFLRSMVRRMISALLLVGSGERDIHWLEEMLCPEHQLTGIQPAPPWGLILTDIKYDGIKWLVDDYALSRRERLFTQLLAYHSTMKLIMDRMK
ncbi:MAG: hypothetical protein ACXQS2_03390 [Methermicoccaceae archaeon]